MDYEKKYRKALERAKRLHSEPTGGTERIVCEQIFPELRWSEDERIRRAIIKGLSSCGKKYWGGFEVKAAIAWLEKQGEQKQEELPRYNIGDILCDLSCNEYDNDAQLNYEIIDIRNGMYICDNGSIPISQQNEYRLVAKKAEQKPIKVSNDEDSVSNELREASFIFAATQMVHKASPEERKLELIYAFEEGAKWDATQKPTWSEEEEEILDEIIDFLENGTVKLQHDLSLYASLLKSLKDRVKTQQEWTMQDEEELRIALDTLVKAGQHSSAKWLKNVCLVPQNKWKPSDAQMKELNYAVNVMASSKFVRENDYCYNVLKSLRDQLKKLK